MKASGADCVCCYGRKNQPANGTQSCSPATTSCCGTKRAAHQDKGPAFNTDCPCRPVVDHTVSISAARAVLDLDSAAHMPLFMAAVPETAGVPAVSFDHACGDLPPPPDLITTFGVLLI